MHTINRFRNVVGTPSRDLAVTGTPSRDLGMLNAHPQEILEC